MSLYALFGYELWSDGCTGFPSGNMLPACLIHDLDYSIGGSAIDKAMADQRLISNMIELGSVSRAYWFDKILHLIDVSTRWGDNTIKKSPAHPKYVWREDDFSIRNMIWYKLD